MPTDRGEAANATALKGKGVDEYVKDMTEFGNYRVRANGRRVEEAAELCGVAAVVESLSPVRLLKTPWTAACQASLSFTISLSLLKLMSIESMMPSNHLILCCPFILLPSVFLSIRVFSNE